MTRRGTAVLAAVCLVLIAIGGLGLLVAVAGQEPSPPGTAGDAGPVAGGDTASIDQPTAPSRRPNAEIGGRASVADRISGPVLRASHPVRLTVPRIGLRTDLQGLGLTRGGALQVPSTGSVAGWFTGAPAPGSLGPSVIAGHVTYDAAPAVFFRLAELRRGDQIEVRREDRRTAVFTVRRVVRAGKDEFPTEEVYGATDHAALRLITCGGRFNVEADSFEDNVIAFAELTGVRRG